MSGCAALSSALSSVRRFSSSALATSHADTASLAAVSGMVRVILRSGPPGSDGPMFTDAGGPAAATCHAAESPGAGGGGAGSPGAGGGGAGAAAGGGGGAGAATGGAGAATGGGGGAGAATGGGGGAGAATGGGGGSEHSRRRRRSEHNRRRRRSEHSRRRRQKNRRWHRGHRRQRVGRRDRGRIQRLQADNLRSRSDGGGGAVGQSDGCYGRRDHPAPSAAQAANPRPLATPRRRDV